MGEALRKRRHGTGRSSGQSWYVDETYLKVHGHWCYLYRAIDRDGDRIDTMLSATRDMRAAQRVLPLGTVGSRLCAGPGDYRRA